MADEETTTNTTSESNLKKWNELPVELRRSEAKRWNYLVEQLNG